MIHYDAFDDIIDDINNGGKIQIWSKKFYHFRIIPRISLDKRKITKRESDR